MSSTVWAIARGDQLAIWSDEEGFILPVWSQQKQAQAALKTFPDHEVRSYPLLEFIDAVLPQFQEDQVMIGLNLDDSMAGTDVSGAELKRLVQLGDA